LLTKSSSDVGNLESSDPIEIINALIDEVDLKLDSTAEPSPDQSIIEGVENLHNEYYNTYRETLDALVVELTGILSSFDYDYYNDVIESINIVKDEQAIEALDNIELITAVRDTDIANVESISLDTLLTFDFGKAAVLAVWPSYMYEDLADGFKAMSTFVYDSATNLDNVSDSDSMDGDNDYKSVFYYTDSTGTEKLRTTLAEAANVESFIALFDKVKSLALQHEQKKVIENFINSLSFTILQLPSSITDSLTAIKGGDDSARNTIINSIYDKLSRLTNADNVSSFTIIEKQQLLAALKEELNGIISTDTKLLNVVSNLLCPSITLYEENYPEFTAKEDDFYSKVTDLANNVKSAFTGYTSNTESALLDAIKDYISDLSNVVVSESNAPSYADYSDKNLLNKLQSKQDLLDWLVNVDITNNELVDESLLPDSYRERVLDLIDKSVVYNKIKTVFDAISNEFDRTKPDENTEDKSIILRSWTNALSAWLAINVLDETNDIEASLKIAMNNLSDSLDKLEEDAGKSKELLELEKVLTQEKQLLAEIKDLDKNNDFYYNVPIESSLAIEFTEGDKKLNTLLNPRTNYDVNNVNNNFVISKLDIDYLTDGIQVARSSKLN